MTRAAGHRLTEISLDSTTYAIEHDAAGRTTQSLDFQLRWDALDNLVGIFNPAGAPIELYAYDAQGNFSFVYDVNNQTSGAFSYDGDRMIQSVNDADTLLWTLFRGPDGVDDFLEFHSAGVPILPIADHRKSVVGAWDMEQRKVIETATYDASGRVALYSNDEALLGNPGVICNSPGYLPFGFNGRWRSNISGFTNMSARWYSPRMGEFLSQDPLRYVDLYNLYGFGAYDSVNRFDPSGQGASQLAKDVLFVDEAVRPLAQKVADVNKIGKDGVDDNRASLCFQFPLQCPGILIWAWTVPTTADGVIGDGLVTAGALPAGAIAKVGTAGVKGVVKATKKIPKVLAATKKIIKKGQQTIYKLTRKPLKIGGKQFGKKANKHMREFGLDIKNAKDRIKMKRIINKIGNNPDRVVKGNFAGQGPGGGPGPVDFRIKGDDVVISKLDGTFVSILKNGVTNPSVRKALGQ